MSRHVTDLKERPTHGRRHTRLRQTHAPATLAALLSVTGLTVGELLTLAREQQWRDSDARVLATNVAGPLRTAQSGQRLPSMWPWIDGLDAIQMEAEGLTRKQIARVQRCEPTTVSSRIGRVHRSADAEAERVEVMGRRLLGAFGAA